ncbi:MAG: class I SAM-dependent methyltransferase [Thermoplasmata archaeon]|nr:class I SAM-dependent methyltransferase [Thermoplasmata archaeon]
MAEESAHSRANRENWNATSRAYQKAHHAELEGDVLWGPSMPPERDLKVLGPSVSRKDVLEVACGGGQSAVYLASQGARVTGIDFSSEQLAHARAFATSKKANVRFIESNAEDLSMLDDHSFDVAFSAWAFGFVEDIGRSFREISRVLRPGGLFAFSWLSPIFMITERGGLAITRSYFDRSPLVDKGADGTEVDFLRTYGDWHRELAGAGFVVTDVLEPEPLPRENTYSDDFPLAKIRMVPGTTIWRARKPRRLEL